MTRIWLLAAPVVLTGVALAWPGDRAAAAQDCPPGYEFAARPYLGPDGSMQQNPGCYPQRGPAPPSFKKRFGAVAYDEPTKEWYSWSKASSLSVAKQRVLNHCREEGGSQCKLMLSYANQCVAIARADDVPGNDSVNTGSSLKDAEANAARACSADWKSNQCEIMLSSCSLHGREEK